MCGEIAGRAMGDAATLKRLGQVYVNHEAPFFLAHPFRAVGQGGHRLSDGVADAVDQRVHPPEFAQSIGGDALHVGCLGGVAGQRQGRAAQGADFPGDLSHGGGGEAGDSHVGPGLGKGQGDTLPDTPSGAHHQDSLAAYVEFRQAH